MPSSPPPDRNAPDPGSSPWAPERVLDHAGWLRTFARALVRDPNDVDDLVQGALGAAVATEEEIRDVRGFLTGTVRRLASRLHRDQRHRRDREWAHAAEQPSETQASDRSLETMDTMRIVLQEVAELPPAQGRCIALRYVEGLEIPVIAARLGTTPSTVRSNLSRGLEALRDRLDARYGDRSTWSALLVPMALSGGVPAASPSHLSASAPGASTAASGLSAAAFFASAMNLKLVFVATVPFLAAWGAFRWISEIPSALPTESRIESPSERADLVAVGDPAAAHTELSGGDAAAVNRRELVAGSALAPAPAIPRAGTAGLTADIVVRDPFSTDPLFDFAVEVTPLDENGAVILAGTGSALTATTDADGHLLLEDLPQGTSSVSLRSLLRGDLQIPVPLTPDRISLDDPEVVLAGVGPTYRFSLMGEPVGPGDEFWAYASGPGIVVRFPFDSELSWSTSTDPSFPFVRFGNVFGSIDDAGPWNIEFRSKDGHLHASVDVSYGRGSSAELIPLNFEPRGTIHFVTHTGIEGLAADMPFLRVSHQSSGVVSHARMEPTASGGETQLGLLLPGTYTWSAPGQVDAAGTSIGGECQVSLGATMSVSVPPLGGPYVGSFAVVDASAIPDLDLSSWNAVIMDLGLVDTFRLAEPERAPDLGRGMWRVPIGPVPLDGWMMSLDGPDGPDEFEVSPKGAVLNRSEGSPSFTITPLAAPVTVNIVLVDANSGAAITGAMGPEAAWLNEMDTMDLGNNDQGELNPVDVPSNSTAQFICRAEGYKATEAFYEPGNGGTELRLELERGWRNRVLVLDMASMGPYAGATVIVDGVELGQSDSEGRLLLELEGPPELIELRLADESFDVMLSPFRDDLLWSEDPIEGYRFVVKQRAD